MKQKIKYLNSYSLLIVILFIAVCLFTYCSDSSSSDPDSTDPDDLVTDNNDDGDVPDLTVTAPQALNVTISGTLQRSKTLTGNYTYYDVEGDDEGNSAYRWLSSDAADGTFDEIPGAIALDYVVTADDIGKYLKFEVTPVALTGTEVTGTASVSVASGPVIEIQAPYATDLRITGILQDTQTVTGNYVYNDAQGDLEDTLSSTYKWYISDSTTGPFIEISGAVSDTYTIAAADEGKYIIFEVIPAALTGSELIGEAVKSPACGPIVAADAPYATNVNITGTLAVGAPLTGNYDYNDAVPDPEGVTTFKWYRGDTETGAYSEIESANLITYDLKEEDKGKYIIFEVTPVATAGTLIGAPVKSVPKGPIKGFADIIVDGEIDEEDWTDVDNLYFTDSTAVEDGGQYNDIQNLYVAWDADNLYIGIKGSFGNGDSSNSVIVYIDIDYDNVHTETTSFNFAGGTYANLDGSSGDSDFGYDYVWVGSWGHQNGSDNGLYARDNLTEISTGVTIVEDGTNKDAAEISIAWSSIGLSAPGNNRRLAAVPIISYTDDVSSPSTNWYDDTGLAADSSAFDFQITTGSGNLMKQWY